MRLPSQLLRRKLSANKGDFGHILILAGCARYSGAAVLCAEGALHSGAGLVTLGIPKSINSAVIRIKPKEVMTLPLTETKERTLSSGAYKKIKDFAKNIDLLIIGPGLGQEKATQALIRKVLAQIDIARIIDADGLNALAGRLNLLKTHNSKLMTILTPHPGEMARLLGTSVKKVQSNRKEIARRFSKKYKVTCVLKGHNTVVADQKGSLYINKTGNPGMASGGCGDVLTGMIGAFLGQGLDAFSAAKYAVYLHGLAGDMAAKKKTQISLIASDIIDKIPEAIKMSS